MSLSETSPQQETMVDKTRTIIGEKCVLVPYREYHVPKYHLWMESEELRMQTASERLTLEQEYEMQKTWSTDIDKCTFIILDKDIWTHDDEIKAMIGDTNLYTSDGKWQSIEVEIMIAEMSFRRIGRALEALHLILSYSCSQRTSINRFFVKISQDNIGSRKLFEKLGFRTISAAPDVFREITMDVTVTDDWLASLNRTFQYKITS